MILYAGDKQTVVPTTPVAPIVQDEVNPWYLGVGITWADFNLHDGVCFYEDVTWGMMARGGYEFNQYFGVEARVIETFWDKGPYDGAPVFHAGLFAKPQYPISERFNIYALAGYGYTKNLGSGRRVEHFDDDWGFSAGIGLEYDLSDRDHDFVDDIKYDREFDGYADQGRGWSLFVDYQRLLIDSDAPDMDVVSFGIRYDF
jgi:OOP family OmpA-OmpF porin